MSFHLSSDNIRLEGTVLKARLQDQNGGFVESAIDLNSFIGNTDGWFRWDDGNFSRTATNIHLELRAGGDPVLCATLQKRDGSYRGEEQGIRLSERIENNNGRLVYKK